MRITRHPLLPPLAGLRNIPPDPAIIARLEGSFARVSARSPEFTDRFYTRLFLLHPGLRQFFPDEPAALEALKGKLVATLAAVIGNLRSPESIRPRLHDLGRRHAALGVRRAHYPPVLRIMVDAIADVLADSWSPELAAEWTRALELVAAIMLDATDERAPLRDDTDRGATTIERVMREPLGPRGSGAGRH